MGMDAPRSLGLRMHGSATLSTNLMVNAAMTLSSATLHDMAEAAAAAAAEAARSAGSSVAKSNLLNAFGTGITAVMACSICADGCLVLQHVRLKASCLIGGSRRGSSGSCCDGSCSSSTSFTARHVFTWQLPWRQLQQQFHCQTCVHQALHSVRKVSG